MEVPYAIAFNHSLTEPNVTNAMTTDSPAQQFRLIRKFVPKALQPTLRGLRKRLNRPRRLTEPFRTVYPFTQAHLIRQENILRLARAVEELKIQGSIVECGVLDGGMAALMAYGTSGSKRPVHLFDSWEGYHCRRWPVGRMGRRSRWKP
jgi:O-methyltransferase